jgi:ribose-phosphate pyrophosphokinase
MKYDVICVMKFGGEFFNDNHIKEALGDKLMFVRPDVFNNGETNIEINLRPEHKKVLLICQDVKSPNDVVMNTMFAIDALKRQEAEVDLFIPCLPYARQDRRNGRNVAITSQVMLRMLEQAGISKLFVVDLHSTQMEGFAKFPIVNIDSEPILIDTIKDKMRQFEGENFVVVSPDAGGVKRAKKYGDALGLPIAIVHKSRDPFTNESISHNVIGSVNGKHCIVVDDMVDSGGTLLDAERLLADNGARTITFAIGHPVLSKPKQGLEKLDIITLNTLSNLPDYLTVKKVETYFLEKVLGVELFEKDFGL